MTQKTFHPQDLVVLKQRLRESYTISTSNDDFANYIKSVSEEISEGTSKVDFIAELGTVLELVFRGHLIDLLKSSDVQKEISPDSDVLLLLKYSFEFALKVLHISSFPRVPFVLVEDILESLTIAKAEAFWTYIEELEGKITHKDLYNKGKLVILKTCNSLIRKLSKSCNTEFCGRVLLFLAAIYPISERSALNLAGKVNVNNITYYENEEEFSKSNGTIPAGDIVATDNQQVAMVTQQAEEDGEEIEVTTTQSILNFETYCSFWKLQGLFVVDNKTMEKVSEWREFVTLSDKVISLFENRDNITATATAAGGSSDSGSSASAGTNHHNHNHDDDYMGSKFLTSSELFSLQIQDSNLQQQICVELLIFIRHIRAKLPLVFINEQKLFTEVSKDVLSIHSRILKVIERLGGNNDTISSFVKRLLGRENQWFLWKERSCQAFEKTSSDSALLNLPTLVSTEDSMDISADSEGSLKRKLDSSAATASSKKGLKSVTSGTYEFSCSEENTKVKARELSQTNPNFQENKQAFLDAEDPSCGIDDEYHPKHDSVFSWRTRRVLANKHLFSFEAMLDGNLISGLHQT